MEGDDFRRTHGDGYCYFNPRPPRGGRPHDLKSPAVPVGISIHALRMEGDLTSFKLKLVFCYFNPRPPRGGRHVETSQNAMDGVFQSTPSAWRATVQIHKYLLRADISIHALRVEGDHISIICDFLIIISIHALRVEGDDKAKTPLFWF